jgi:hypothetical protein
MKYKIKESSKGNTVYTIPPTYKRKEEGIFKLDENLSQKDMGYLKEVIKCDDIEYEVNNKE